MARPPSLTLEFFHDVVCGWCYNLSPRLRRLAEEFDLEIRHRTFVLQDGPERMVEVFGSMEQAKATILGHWAACREASESPERFDIEGMRAASFDYPHGLPGALGCVAAERLGGPEAHWRYFDAVQAAHLGEARNVADWGVLVEIAESIGLDVPRFRRLVTDPLTLQTVEGHRRRAHLLQVTQVPTVIVRETGRRLVNAPLEDLRMQLQGNLSLVAAARAVH
ncbi:DsbA family protein [Halomonas beimenensis]|uniref:DSBA oxidoreductase n=1 Tax=Halomonas beimenensis TaxID=475662 RepID=A0A291P659_9GAMM|nr:DsbA family protein [Halomonas beimenensis]ATJ82339.1 DSBA oxidoreductase [Halomonas beimenensis]